MCAAKLIRGDIENLIEINQFYAVLGIFKGNPSMAFHAHSSQQSVRLSGPIRRGDFTR